MKMEFQQSISKLCNLRVSRIDQAEDILSGLKEQAEDLTQISKKYKSLKKQEMNAQERWNKWKD